MDGRPALVELEEYDDKDEICDRKSSDADVGGFSRMADGSD
jgi:hypothetical protein